MRKWIGLIVLQLTASAAVSVLGAANSQPGALPVPLIHAHAHNDYIHKRPLLDALDHGFCSVEADIYLVGGELLVAHDRDEVQAERTLEALYLRPLRERVLKNGGRVYPKGPGFTLLIDIKSDAESTYAALHDLLKKHADVLTTFSPDVTRPGAVTVIISGNRPIRTMAAQTDRYCAVDGRLADLDSDVSIHLMPLISDVWGRVFRWQGIDSMPEEELRALRQVVQRIHQKGCRVRFWGAPDIPAAWKEMLAAGVDLINTDNLSGLREFLLNQDKGRP